MIVGFRVVFLGISFFVFVGNGGFWIWLVFVLKILGFYLIFKLVLKGDK